MRTCSSPSRTARSSASSRCMWTWWNTSTCGRITSGRASAARCSNARRSRCPRGSGCGSSSKTSRPGASTSDTGSGSWRRPTAVGTRSGRRMRSTRGIRATEYGLAEEELELPLGGLGGVAAVHQVLGDDGPEVAADRAGRGIRGVGRAHHRPPDADGPLALEADDHHRSRGDERDELAEERLVAVLAVVLLGERAVDRERADLGDAQALVLRATQHLTHQTAPNAVRLHDEQRRFDSHLQESSRSAERASATVYREPVTRTMSSSDAAFRAAVSASPTLPNVSVGTPAAASACAISPAGRARTLSVDVA